MKGIHHPLRHKSLQDIEQGSQNIYLLIKYMPSWSWSSCLCSSPKRTWSQCVFFKCAYKLCIWIKSLACGILLKKGQDCHEFFLCLSLNLCMCVNPLTCSEKDKKTVWCFCVSTYFLCQLYGDVILSFLTLIKNLLSCWYPSSHWVWQVFTNMFLWMMVGKVVAVLILVETLNYWPKKCVRDFLDLCLS